MVERDEAEGYWARLERSHRVRIVAACGVAVVLIAALSVLLAKGQPAEGPPSQPAVTTSKPSVTTTPTVSSAATSSVESTGSQIVEEREAGEKEPSAQGGERRQETVGRIAYRAGGGVWVADEDGGGAKRLLDEERVVAYSLSPDGKTLAVVQRSIDGQDRSELLLLDAASGQTLAAVPVQPDGMRLSWFPDSRSLAFDHVKRMSRTGEDAVLLAKGALARVSPDGRLVAMTEEDGSLRQGVRIVPADGGSAARVAASAGASGFCWAGPEALFSVFTTGASGSGAPSGASIRRIGLDGATQELWSREFEGKHLVVGALHPSPDGSTLLFAEMGDDGYSRALVLAADGGSTPLSTRLDSYPAGWTSDGRVLLFEGNTFQGERSRLVSVRPDGTGRRTLVEGATR